MNLKLTLSSFTAGFCLACLGLQATNTPLLHLSPYAWLGLSALAILTHTVVEDKHQDNPPLDRFMSASGFGIIFALTIGAIWATLLYPAFA